MKYNILRLLPITILGAVLLSGCAGKTIAENSPRETEDSAKEETLTSGSALDGEQTTDNITKKSKSGKSTTTSDNVVIKTFDEYFSNRDLSGEIDLENAVEITLNDGSISANSDGVSISGSTITITKEGTYIFSGTLSDGNIIVNTDKEEKVQIVLDGVSITSKTSAPIYVAQANKVFVTLAEGTTNTLINGDTFTEIDGTTVDGVIYSKDDITLNGTGTLKITSPAGKGITGKDEVTIASGTYEITSSEAAIRANDSVAIADGSFTIISDTDGIHAEKSDDDSLGEIYIAGGSFHMNVKDDGIHATTTLVVDGGDLAITAAEGFEATLILINDGKISIDASDDGINAARKSSLYSPKVEINGGDIAIVMGMGDTDGIDSNGDIIINGGTVSVTGNSTFDYDGEGIINGGTVISNGEEIITLPNQMMGGRGGMKGPNGGMERPNGEMEGPNGGMERPNGEMERPNGGMKGPKGSMKGTKGA